MIRVGAKTNTNALAGCIANELRRNEQVTVSALGPNAVNQAVKAVATASRFLEREGAVILARVSFFALETSDGQRTSVHFALTVSRDPASIG